MGYQPNTKYNKILTRAVFSFISMCLIGSIVYASINVIKDNTGNKNENGVPSIVSRDGIKENSSTITPPANIISIPVTKNITSPNIITAFPSTSPTVTTYIGWNTYTNNTYNYSFKYPPTWKIDTTYSDPNLTQACKSSRVSLIAPGSYIFRFEYALNNCPIGSNGGSDARTYKSVEVNKQLLTKGYLSDCTRNVSTCNQYTNKIVYSNYDQSNPSHVDTIFTLNGKLSSMTFTPPNGQVLLTDNTFSIVDGDLDNLVSSITF